MAGYQRRYFSRRGGKLSAVHVFVGFTVLFCLISMILIRYIWLTEKEVYIQDLARNYFSFGDPAENCLVHFDPQAPIHLKPLAMILRHLRRYGATGLIVPLQETLINMAAARSDDSTSPLEDVLNIIPPSEVSKNFVDFFTGAAKENLTVVPIAPDVRTILFYLRDYPVPKPNNIPENSLTCCGMTKDGCQVICMRKMADYFDHLCAAFTAHKVPIPPKILIGANVWSYGLDCLASCRSSKPAEVGKDRSINSVPDKAGNEQYFTEPSRDEGGSILDHEFLQEAGLLVVSTSKPPSAELHQLMQATANHLKRRHDMTAMIDVTEIGAGWSYEDRIAFLMRPGLENVTKLIDVRDPGFRDLLHPDPFDAAESDARNEETSRSLSSVRILPRLTVDVSWDRSFCHWPFPTSRQLLDCVKSLVDGALKDVTELRNTVFLSRGSVHWTGTVLRICGTELAMLPFVMEVATAGTALLRTGMPLENLRDIVKADPVSCNFLLKNPDEVLRQMMNGNDAKICKRAHGMRLVMDIMYTIRLMRKYELSCDHNLKESTWSNWLNPVDDVCDDLKNRACRMRREVSRDMREWHPEAACDLWVKRVLGVRTVSCPEEDLELFRHVVRTDDRY